jgi:hypothetical protein
MSGPHAASSTKPNQPKSNTSKPDLGCLAVGIASVDHPCGSGQDAYVSFFYTTDASSVVKALTADPVCIAKTSPPSTGEPITIVNCNYAKYRAEIAIEDKPTLLSSATVMEK